MTQRKKGLPPSLYGIGSILSFLAALAFLPPLLKKTDHRAEMGGSAGAAKTSTLPFPLDTTLPVIPNPGAKDGAATVNLKTLAAESKNGLIINFWATWCPPCVEELPSLETLNRQLSTKPGLPKLLTVSVDDSPQEVLTFFKTLDYPVSLPVVFDKDAALSRAVGTTKFPETYWVMPDGKVRHKWVGPQNWLGADVLGLISAAPAR